MNRKAFIWKRNYYSDFSFKTSYISFVKFYQLVELVYISCNKRLFKTSLRITLRFRYLSWIFLSVSQTFHNIQLLSIEFSQVITDGLADLIYTVQQNLKYLYIIMQYSCTYLTTDIINSLTKLLNTSIKLDIYGEELQIPLSFIYNLTRLQIMVLTRMLLMVL